MQRFILVISAWLILFAGAASAEPPSEPAWLTLPPTPQLPSPARSGYAEVNGVKIWYAVFGQGKPVVLLHGGLANSNYWGQLVPALGGRYQVIVMDSRGHGRSTRNSEPIGYDLMASDVTAVMDFLKIEKVAIIGWSDGAIIGLDIAIHHPARLTRLFAFAANSDPSGVADIAQSAVFNQYLVRAKAEYQSLSPTPNEYDSFLGQVTKMWETQPHFTAEILHRITTPTWIVDADHDEAIKRADTLFLADQIPNSGLLIEPRVSHFAFLQDAAQFNDDVLHFLEQE
jgi:pimeloyl-ACP methyl ester carboxylesterase